MEIGLSMKKLWKGIAAAGASALMLAACSGGGSGAEETPDSSQENDGQESDEGQGGGGDLQGTIEFQTDIASDNSMLELFRDMAEEFEAANDGTSVTVSPNTADYEADMKVLMAGGGLPDLFMTHGWSLLRYGQFLEPLNDRDWAEHFNPALDAAMKDDEGNFFALPINTDIAGIVYNKTVVEDAGVDVTELNDWDDFNEALAKIDDSGAQPLASSGKDAWLTGNVADFVVSGVTDEAALERFQSGTFDADAYRPVLELVEGWVDDGFVNPDYTSVSEDEIVQLFAQDKLGFLITQNGVVNRIFEYNPDAQMGFMPIPSFTGEPFLVGGEGMAIGVAQDSEAKDVALAFLDFLAQPENMEKLASHVNGPPGLLNATSDLGELEDSYDQFANEDYPLWPYFDRVYLPNGMWDTMITTTESIFTGQGTVDQALTQMENDYDSLFDQQS